MELIYLNYFQYVAKLRDTIIEMMQKFDEDKHNERMGMLLRKEEDALIESLSAQYGYPYLDLRGVTINPEAIKVIPEQEARDSNIVAFELKNRLLSVAIRNPNNRDSKAIIDSLRRRFQVTVFMSSVSSLEHAWARYKDIKTTEAESKGVFDISESEFQRLAHKFKTNEKIAEHIQSLRTANNARRTSETMAAIFAGALGLGASDVHIEPEENGVRLRYRLDGVLQDIFELERKLHNRIMSRFKLLAGMKINIRDEAQDGRFTFDVGEKIIEVRASIIPGAEGESIVMRLLDPTVASFQMEKLGLNEKIKSVILEEISRPSGMIVTTGPTGSGKTTALYAFLQEAHSSEVKIITIEDPVEYKLDDIVQTQVSDGYSFGSGLRALLRQDPDIIMVGEIRDREVAETAINAAQTGHLVFSTLHTNSAAAAFSRLIDLGADYRTLGNALNLVLGQRLIRKLCEHCKQTRPATAEEFKVLSAHAEQHPQGHTLSEPLELSIPNGCAHCGHTGYKGRQGIYEAIRIDEAITEAILRDPREHTIQEAAKPQGIPTMPQDGSMFVVNGITSYEELTRVIDITKGLEVKTKKPDEKPKDDLDLAFLENII